MINNAAIRTGNWLSWSLKLSHPETTLPDEIVEVFKVLENGIAYVYPNIENRVEPFEDDVVQMGKGIISFEALQPIPLNNDWLQKAGFVLKGPTALLLDDDALSFNWNGNQLMVADNKPIQYLHQLQNFYADATGKTLTIGQ